MIPRGPTVQTILHRSFLLSLACLAVAWPARACNVPVFRYALERWPADRYLVILCQRGPLAAEDQALADTLAKAADREDGPANFSYHLIDLDKEAPETTAPLFVGEPKPDLPWLVVRYPREAGIKGHVWAGRLNREVVQTLLDSPARRELGKRILAGDSAVWVLLESGKKDKDDAAAALLTKQLQALPKALKLPDRTTSPQDQIDESGPPLHLAFSLVRVSRTDPAEKLFVAMLLHLEEDLGKFDEPMVFAVFGRGRCLLPMVGKGITAENIHGDAAALVAACSCEVKRLNPGVDLLLTVNWEERLKGRPAGPALPDSAALVPVAVPKGLPPEPVAVAGPEAASEPLPATARLVLVNWLVSGLLALSLLAGGVLFFIGRAKATKE